MAAAGLESILIKVAGAGLDTRDLGRSITDSAMVDKLFDLVSPIAYGSRRLL